MGYRISIYYNSEKKCYAAQVLECHGEHLISYGAIPVEALGRLMLIIPKPFMITEIFNETI